MERRDFLRMAGLTAASLAIDSRFLLRGASAAMPTISSVKRGNWSQASTWSLGRVPLSTDVVQVNHRVLLDSSATVAYITIQPAGRLVFETSKTLTLTSTGNVVVMGTLKMHPASASIVHTLRFTGFKESNFVGGGMDVLDSDVGLWVMDMGKLNLVGTARVPWNRTGDDPTWLNTDELVLCPSDIGSQDFTPFVKGSPVPSVTLPNGAFQPTEVLNLTRNVRIEGQDETHRSHVFIHSSEPQRIEYIWTRYMGPRKGSGIVLGRYGLHFHEGGDGSSGTNVIGVVVRDGGSHAFVPHSANGLTFTQCIAYNTKEEAFWWDVPDRTDALTLDGCLAACINSGSRVQKLSGFVLGAGADNVARGCVAVGVLGGTTSSGFWWPDDLADDGVWSLDGCVAHNNVNGLYASQNRASPQLISGYVGYRNFQSGVLHGSYRNSYIYNDIVLYNNGTGGPDTQYGSLGEISHWADSPDFPVQQQWNRALLDGAGMDPRCVAIASHNLPGLAPVLYLDPILRGWVETPIEVNEMVGHPATFDFVHAHVGSPERDLQPSDVKVTSMLRGSLIRSQSRDDTTAWQIDSAGRVTYIQPFYPY